MPYLNQYSDAGNPYSEASNPYITSKPKSTATTAISKILQLNALKNAGKYVYDAAGNLITKGTEAVKGLSVTEPTVGTEGLDSFNNLQPTAPAETVTEYPAFSEGTGGAGETTSGMSAGMGGAGEGGVSTAGLESFNFAAADPALAGGGAGEAATYGIGGSGVSGTGASSAGSAGTSAAGVAAYIAAAELVKSKYGGLEKGYDERSYMEKATSSPGSLIGAGTILTNLFPEDSPFYKYGREMARIEQQVMVPIDRLLGTKDNSWIPDVGDCIIVSACTGRDSYEVNIARTFRDRYMDEETLTGYYALCVFVVPFIQKYPLLKRIVKRCLVDRLVDYGEWRLGFKPNTELSTSGVVKKVFLGLCRHIGKGVDTVLAGQEV